MKRYQYVLFYIVIFLSTPVLATTDKYVIDVRHKHAYIQFKVSHQGFSYVFGQFEKLKGAFCYDSNEPSNSRIEIEVDVASLDTMHEERDGHLRSKDYLNTEEFPKARFISSSFEATGENSARLTGELTLHGISKTIAMDVTRIGMGKGMFGQYRAGFEGTFIIPVADFGLKYYLGDAANSVEIYVMLEGVRSKYAKIEC